MTTNNPEVVAFVDVHSGHGKRYVSLKRGVDHLSLIDGEALIRLSDYEALQAECEKLRKDAEAERQLQRAAQRLPEGWRIVVEVEKDSGWVDVYDPDYRRIEIGGGGSLAEQIEQAIDAALQEGA